MTVAQSALILHHLRKGKSITPLEALTWFNCWRLGARVWELKRKGWPIKTTIITGAGAGTGKRYASYTLAGPR